MPRLLLSDEHWSKLRKILRQMAIYDKPDLRLTVEGILYRMRVGCPWRDLPEAFGCWNSIYKHFNAWSAAGKWVNLFKALVVEPDMEWIFIDGSYAKAHQHSSGAASNADEAIGKSRAGNTSKIHLVENAFARLKHYRAVASRFDKLKRNYESVVAMACMTLWLPM